MKLFGIVLLVTLTACSTTGDKERQQSAINKPTVDKVLSKGTPQAKVLEALGAPNTVSSEGDGREVWGYLRRASNSSSSSVGATVWNSSLRYFSWGYLSGDVGSRSSTSHDTTLIVYFDKSKRVTNHTFRSEIY